MAMKRHSTLSKTPEKELHHQMQFNVTPRIPFFFLVGGSYPAAGNIDSKF